LALGAVFPTVKGRDLTFDTKWMPHDFEGARNLVVLAFRMRHQQQVNTWIPFANSWAAQDAGFRFYEVPVIQYMFPLYHDFIDKGMANGIRDPETLQRTFTLYTNVGQFTQQLGLPTTEEIYALLIDGRGRVLAASSGPYAKEKGDSLWRAAQMQRRSAEPG
jgi:hypothetical protein